MQDFLQFAGLDLGWDDFLDEGGGGSLSCRGDFDFLAGEEFGGVGFDDFGEVGGEDAGGFDDGVVDAFRPGSAGAR